jgi:hypothetical protein
MSLGSDGSQIAVLALRAKCRFKSVLLVENQTGADSRWLRRNPPDAAAGASSPSSGVQHLGLDLEVVGISASARDDRRSRRAFGLIRIYARENATHRAVGSVASAVRYLAKKMMLGDLTGLISPVNQQSRGSVNGPLAIVS